MMVSFIWSFSQDTTTAKIDSLIVVLTTNPTDSLKSEVYIQLSYEYLNLNHIKSFDYTDLAIEHAEKSRNDNALINGYLSKAHLELAYNLNYTEAQRNYEKGLELAEKANDSFSKMKAYQGLSYVFNESGNFELALDNNQKAIDIAKDLQDYQFLSEMHAYRGGLYEDINDKNAAIDQYAEVLAIERKNDFSETSNASLIAVARYYYLIEDPGQSLKYYRIALKKFERLNNLRWVAYTHSEMSRLYIYKKDYKRAEQHGLKGLSIAEENDFKKELGDNLLVLSEVYEAMDSTQLSLDYAKRYDSLQSSLSPLPIQETVVPSENASVENSNATKGMNGFIQAFIILLFVIPLILYMGFSKK